MLEVNQSSASAVSLTLVRLARTFVLMSYEFLHENTVWSLRNQCRGLARLNGALGQMVEHVIMACNTACNRLFA